MYLTILKPERCDHMTEILEKVKQKIAQLNHRIEVRRGETYFDESKKKIFLEERLGVYEDLLPDISSLIATMESLQEQVKKYKWEDEQFSWLQEQMKTCSSENIELKSQIESQKEEIEKLKGVLISLLPNVYGLEITINSEIARLSHETP